MPDSRAKRILDAIKTSLAGIVGDGGANYWFTPDAVVDVADLTTALLDTTVTTQDPEKAPTIYAVIPVRWPRAAKTNRQSLMDFTFDLMLAKRFAHDNESPFPSAGYAPPSPNRFEAQSRMQRDVEKKICGGDLTLGISNGPENTQIVEWDVSPENTFIQGWAVVFGRAIVTWRYVRDDP